MTVSSKLSNFDDAIRTVGKLIHLPAPQGVVVPVALIKRVLVFYRSIQPDGSAKYYTTSDPLRQGELVLVYRR